MDSKHQVFLDCRVLFKLSLLPTLIMRRDIFGPGLFATLAKHLPESKPQSTI